MEHSLGLFAQEEDAARQRDRVARIVGLPLNSVPAAEGMTGWCSRDSEKRVAKAIKFAKAGAANDEGTAAGTMSINQTQASQANPPQSVGDLMNLVQQVNELPPPSGVAPEDNIRACTHTRAYISTKYSCFSGTGN